MRTVSIAAALVALSSASLSAQSSVDPSGHWEGAIQAPNGDVKIEVDLAKNSNGELAATFSRPGGALRGFPLTNVGVDGRNVRFVITATSGGGAFEGVLSDDAKSISGKFVTTEGGHSIPFTVTRTGDPRMEPPIKNPPIGRELTGTWNGTLDINGKQSRLVLTLTNQSDGTATGSLVFLDLGGMEISTGIAQKGANVTLDLEPMGASYSATLNAGTELVGVYSTEGIALPLTFRRAAASPAKS